MTELQIILKKLREKKGITQQKLVELSGLGQGTIGDIERGKIKRGSPKTLEKIAGALNLTEDEKIELFSVLVPKDIAIKLKQDEVIEKQKIDIVQVPVYGKVSAGNGELLIDDAQILRYIPMAKGTVPKGAFFLEINGDSMEPTLHDGETALVNPNDIDYIENKIYVSVLHDEGYIKRIVIDENAIMLISDNPKYRPIFVREEEKDYFRIIGRVIKVVDVREL